MVSSRNMRLAVIAIGVLVMGIALTSIFTAKSPKVKKIRGELNDIVLKQINLCTNSTTYSVGCDQSIAKTIEDCKNPDYNVEACNDTRLANYQTISANIKANLNNNTNSVSTLAEQRQVEPKLILQGYKNYPAATNKLINGELHSGGCNSDAMCITDMMNVYTQCQANATEWEACSDPMLLDVFKTSGGIR